MGPSWSPDGQSIAFINCCADHRAADDGPLLEVDLLDLASGRVERLGANVETDLNGPSWVPGDAAGVDLGAHLSVLFVNRYD